MNCAADTGGLGAGSGSIQWWSGTSQAFRPEAEADSEHLMGVLKGD